MKSRTGKFRLGVTALAVLTLSMASVVSHAQQEGGPPPGGPGGFGGQGPGGGRGFGGFGRMQATTVPIEVLTPELKLSTTQADKIKAIQTAYNKDRSALMPARGGQGGPGGGGQGGPGGGGQGFDREAMQAMFQKMQTMDKAANDKITAVLTDDQKAALPGLIQMLGGLQSAGIQPQALSVLKMTFDQKKKAVTISRETDQATQEAMQNQDRDAMQEARTRGREKIQALLTDDQKAALAKYAKDHPRPAGFGGPGGRPGGQGGPGGPGGPGQGGDGPPPPADGNGPPPVL